MCLRFVRVNAAGMLMSLLATAAPHVKSRPPDESRPILLLVRKLEQLFVWM